MASNDESSRVPFKWEEAPGKPIAAPAHTSPCDPETIAFSPPTTSLQLPPKLQFPLHRKPSLSLPQSPCERPPPHRLHQISPLSLHSRQSPSPNHHKLKRLYTYLLNPASWSHPLTHPSPSPSPSPSWSSSASDATHNELAIKERFFFDKALPKHFKYSVSMPDSWKARLPIHEEYKRQDALVNGEAQLSCLAMEEHEAESDASSPWHPIVLHGRHDSACSWQAKELGVDEDDDDDDEGFHDSFSTASSSLEKRSDDSMESTCPSSPPPWFLDFGPEEMGGHQGKERSKLVVKLVAIVNIKKIMSSKVCKLRKRGPDLQASMWSPTLATYFSNEQKEEKEGMSASRKLEEEHDDDDDDDDDESPSMDRPPSSHTFRINPNYHPPSLILRAHLHTDNDFVESERSSSFKLQFSQELDDDNDEGEKEEEQHEGGLQTLKHRLSLREQLAEFGDEYLLHFVPKDQSLTPPILDSQRGEPSPCKGMCKVRNTVKVLVTTIKLILVQTEVRKRKEGQRPSRKYGGCFKPTMGTISPFPSTHIIKHSTKIKD